jgi:hypothetical protein
MPGFFRLSCIQLPDERQLLPIYSTVDYTDEELNAKFMSRQFVSALKPL